MKEYEYDSDTIARTAYSATLSVRGRDGWILVNVIYQPNQSENKRYFLTFMRETAKSQGKSITEDLSR
jgi:hypothetical protein